MYRGEDAGATATQGRGPLVIEYETPQGKKNFEITTSYAPYAEKKVWARRDVSDWSYVLHMNNLPPELYETLKTCVEKTNEHGNLGKPILNSVCDTENNKQPGNMHAYSIKSLSAHEVVACLVNTMKELGYKVWQDNQLRDPAELNPKLEAMLEYAREHQPGAPRATPFTAR